MGIRRRNDVKRSFDWQTMPDRENLIMNKKQKCGETAFFLVLILMSISSLTLQAVAQKRQEAVPVVIYPPKPAVQASVAGQVRPFKLTRGGLKASIFAHPVPQLWLVFPPVRNAAKVTIKLPSDATKSVLDCWAAELEYRYKKAFEAGSLQKRVNDDYALGRVNVSVLSKLQSLDIDAPTGRRKISDDEAGRIIRFLAESAQNVVEQAKKHKKARSIA